jgi:hypothetical protein
MLLLPHDDTDDIFFPCRPPPPHYLNISSPHQPAPSPPASPTTHDQGNAAATSPPSPLTSSILQKSSSTLAPLPQQPPTLTQHRAPSSLIRCAVVLGITGNPVFATSLIAAAAPSLLAYARRVFDAAPRVVDWWGDAWFMVWWSNWVMMQTFPS